MALSEREVDRVVEAARLLDLKPRGDRWCHLSLCVIDAVFSIGARYASTWNTARRYAAYAGLVPVTAPAEEVQAGRCADTEETLSEFADRVSDLAPEEFARIVGNLQRTSSRGGIRKAEAVQQYAAILQSHDVERLADVGELLSDPSLAAHVEAALATVPGHGSGVRVSYLWMLTGDDHHVKADRMVTRWLSSVLGRPVAVAEAGDLVRAASDQCRVTPWVLDHAIWRRQRLV